MASEKLEQLVTQLDALTLLEASELSKMLQEKWGVSAAAPMAMAAIPGMVAPAAAAEAAPAVEEKTEFDVILTEYPANNKIPVIKVVRELTGLGLKEAKEAVEGVPTTLRTAVSKEEAAAAKAKLDEVGAVVEIK
jgi:large subunit ribosomal protein L7/L12